MLNITFLGGVNLLTGSKGETVLRRIADLLLSYEEGDRIPPILELQQRFGVGAGTIVRAIKDLEESDGVAISARQRYGSTIARKNLPLLWKLGGNSQVIGAFPLPYSREFQGLAMGIREELQNKEIPFTPLYANGGRERIQVLLSRRVDFVVLSLSAAHQACSENPDLQISLDFGEGTYYRKNSVLVIYLQRLNGIRTPRIGIDRESYDHTRLTKAEFPGCDYVDVSYSLIPDAIISGSIDYAVWHRTAFALSLEQQQKLELRLPKNPKTLPIADAECSNAAIVARSENKKIGAVLAIMDAKKVLRLQRKVVEERLAPVY